MKNLIIIKYGCHTLTQQTEYKQVTADWNCDGDIYSESVARFTDENGTYNIYSENYINNLIDEYGATVTAQ